MGNLPRSAEIVIIGGGVMGASTAYHLAARGCRNVVLLEKERFFGTGATGRCAGGMRYQFSTEVNIRLSLESLPMLDRFEAEIGQAIGRRRCGYLFLLTQPEELPLFERNVALQQSLGVPTQWLDRAGVQRRVPQIRSDDVLAATFNPDDGIADPHGVVAGYIAAARRLGAQAYEEAGVTAVDPLADGRLALHTPRGTLHAARVVNAAGPWAGAIGDLLDAPLPITPVRRQWLTTGALPTLAADFPFVIDFARSLYFHPEGDGVLTGMSNPHQPPGFDQRVDLDWELVHMEAAIERLPLLETAGLQARWAGLYENTPDAHPIISAVPQRPGVYVVAGFSGHGFMHGPIAGKLMSEILLDGAAHSVDISSLDYARFAEGRLVREYNVI